MKRLLDAVMDRRARRLHDLVSPWLPREGRVLDLGSGTGHLAARLSRDRGLSVTAADVTDIHVVGPAPVPIAGDRLPFETATFSCALLCFILAYPPDPAGVLAEVARVTRGPIVIVQTLHGHGPGLAWLRVREFFWTRVAFAVSRLLGYVPSGATFTMRTRRFFTAESLGREVAAAGLCVRAERTRPVLPGRTLVVTAWRLERDA